MLDFDWHVATCTAATTVADQPVKAGALNGSPGNRGSRLRGAASLRHDSPTPEGAIGEVGGTSAPILRRCLGVAALLLLVEVHGRGMPILQFSTGGSNPISGGSMEASSLLLLSCWDQRRLCLLNWGRRK